MGIDGVMVMCFAVSSIATTSGWSHLPTARPHFATAKARKRLPTAPLAQLSMKKGAGGKPVRNCIWIAVPDCRPRRVADAAWPRTRYAGRNPFAVH